MSSKELEEHSFVKVLYDFQYKTAEGRQIAIKKNERLYLIQKTNTDWWQVIRTWEQRSFYVPATYVKEISTSTSTASVSTYKNSNSRKFSDEDNKDLVLELPLDKPKYKNMPKETSSAMKNVKRWLTGANNDAKQEFSKPLYTTDESYKHNAMDYASRAELKVGLAALKSKSLERNHKDIVNVPTNNYELKPSKKLIKTIAKTPPATTGNCDTTSIDSIIISNKNIKSELSSHLDPFKEELENSIGRRRKKSENADVEELIKENKKQSNRIRTKSSHSDDSYIESDIDIDQQVLLRNSKTEQIDSKSKLRISLPLKTNTTVYQNPNSPPKRNSKSLDFDAKQFCLRTERSLSPKPIYGHQLSIAEGQITDEELNDDNDNDNDCDFNVVNKTSTFNDHHKILNDKRRTWAVEELMSELTQMCKERVNIKKQQNLLTKHNNDTKNHSFDPLDELAKELHEMNLQRSEKNIYHDDKSLENIGKTVAKDINNEKQNDVDINSITEHLNPSEIFDSQKSKKTNAFNFPIDDINLIHKLNHHHQQQQPLSSTSPSLKPLKSPKSPKIDEYNEANILNDCSPDNSLVYKLPDVKQLSSTSTCYNKHTGVAIDNQVSHFKLNDSDESPCYSNIKMNLNPNNKNNIKKPSNSENKLKLTPSLEKLANEIQFIPSKPSSNQSFDSKLIDKSQNVFNKKGNITSTSSNNNNINENTKRDCLSNNLKFNFDYKRRKPLVYNGSFNTKREGRYFHRSGSSENEEEEDDDDDYNDTDDEDYYYNDFQYNYNNDNEYKLDYLTNLKKSKSFHCTNTSDNCQKYPKDQYYLSKLYKRKSRSLSDICSFEDVEDKEESNEIINIEKSGGDDNNYRPIPLPRKIIFKNDVKKPIQPSGNLNETIIKDINVDTSTAVGFKSLLCTSDSGSDTCLQSKELLFTEDQNSEKLSFSYSKVKKRNNISKIIDSPLDDIILSSNASSEALQSQSESEVTNPTSTLDISIQQNHVNLDIDLPPGWIQKYDTHTDQIYFVNGNGDRWFSSNDEEGKIYFFEENSNESSWVLPTFVPNKVQMKLPFEMNQMDTNGDNDVNKDDDDDDDDGGGGGGNNDINKEDNLKVKEMEEMNNSNANNKLKQINRNINDNKDIQTKKVGGLSMNDWPQLSLGGNMKILKEGSLNRTKITENGKKLRKNWNTSYAVLTELFLLFFKDSKTFNSMIKNGQSLTGKVDMTVDLNGAIIESGDRTSSRKNVYMISTVLGLQVLIQSDNTAVATEWFQHIHGSICKLPISTFKNQSKPFAGSEIRKISTSKSSNDTNQLVDDSSSKSSKISRSRSIRLKRLDDSLEDLSETVAEKQTKIKARLKRFFQRRPTVESLVKNGIYKNEPAFGSYLNDICPMEYPRIPLFVKTCIEVLESNEENMKTDGLYRASGNLSQIQKIRLQIDQYNYNVLSQEEDVHVLTGALKLFFRELKEPLIPSSFFKDALNASVLKNTQAKIQSLRDIVNLLPPSNYDTLQFLLKHLLKVTSYQEYNRMHIPNLAIVFGPTLMWPAEESLNMALDLMQQNLVIECLLENFQFIFEDSSNDCK